MIPIYGRMHRVWPFSLLLSDIVDPLYRAAWGRVLVTFAVGTAGGIVFALTGLPAALLSGSMIAVAIGSVAGMRAEIPDPVRGLCFFVIGIAMGAGVNPDALSKAVQWPLSLAILVVAVFGIGTAVYFFLSRIAGWDRLTSFYACVPGALTFVLALAVRTDADIRSVAVSHSIRLFFLLAILPLILVGSSLSDEQAVPDAGLVSLADAGLLVGVAIGATILLSFCRVPAAIMVGPFLASSVLYGSGLVSGAIMPWAVGAALVVLGATVGARFGETDLATLRRLVLVSLGALIVGLCVAVAFSVLTVAVTGLGFGQVLLAFAPGGLEVMIILAFVLNLDPAYVAAHQVARLVGMMLFLPMIVAWLAPGKGRQKREETR